MSSLLAKYKIHFNDRDFLLSAFLAILFLGISLVINFYAGIYAMERASNAVTDIILSNIPVFDVDGIFVYGFVAFVIFVALLCLIEPRRLPFTFKSVALFVLVRSLFVMLTHIGPFPSVAQVSSSLAGFFTFGADLFFSGHTGMPFLMSLLFWDNKYLRGFFMCASVMFGVVVLLGHLHYSIDVLSAFFITYTIYHIATILFRKDMKMFATGL